MNLPTSHPWATVLSAMVLAAAGCTTSAPTPGIRIEALSRGAVRAVNIRVERTRDGAVVRGSVYAGPGYRSWQRHYLTIEVLQPDQHVAFRTTTTFAPDPIPRIVRSRGRSHFTATLPELPPPGSTVRITPRSGPQPKSSTSS